MINRRTVFEIHRLYDQGYSERKIARTLKINRISVRRYLKDPQPTIHRKSVRHSILDPFKDQIMQLLDKDPDASAPVILQRLQSKGFKGKVTTVRRYLRTVRGSRKKQEAFIRFETPPGKQMQIDWGHFDSLSYGDAKRKLYALAVCEGYSRMAYVEFTHSQKQETLHQCLLNAFKFFGGTPEQIVVDNMLTAVTERQGSLIRFNESFLDFLLPFKIAPAACNIRAPQEKGKIEVFIKYLRKNFWPLRSFADIHDVQSQVRSWLDNIANVRIHQTTLEKPLSRFAKLNLRPLPNFLPDCRETSIVYVHKDFAVRFDGNMYTVPPWTIGKNVVLKADTNTVTIYLQDKKIASHQRCFKRKERVESEYHKNQVKKIKRKLWEQKDIAAFASWGVIARQYLECMCKANVPIQKNILKILKFKDEYGLTSILLAISKAVEHKAYGADYIENILYQEMTPQKHHLPVKLKNEDLNRIQLKTPSLAQYDAYILKRRKK